ncbi:hypothetical protein KR059_006460, partial [Drosophila kikkawai]
MDFSELGLLDTGANISCIGSSLALTDFSKYPNFKSILSQVRTADAKSHQVLGSLKVKMQYQNKEKDVELFIIPSIAQRLILGIDFWRAFELAPGIISSILNEEIEVSEEEEKYPLTVTEKQQLEAVKELFPNFEKQGLGRTALIKHSIDIGENKPMKQRYYPVSPAVEKLMYTEIDRMLSLGVIEPSQSAWSSPMRLVVKPNKVRLCLDARKLNDATKKDAYPLQSIEGIFARLPKANMISKLDLKDAYWQIELT